MVKSLLVCRIRLLEVIHHQVAVPKATPDVSIIWIQLEDIIYIIDSLVKLLLPSQNARNGRHGLYRSRVVAQSMFIGEQRLLRIAEQFLIAT